MKKTLTTENIISALRTLGPGPVNYKRLMEYLGKTKFPLLRKCDSLRDAGVLKKTYDRYYDDYYEIIES